jgi:hypothetical protein
MYLMDDVSRSEIANSLERLADQVDWNPELWQRCHDLVQHHRDDELLGYVYDEIVHYSGVFHSPNVFGLRVRPRRNQLELYRKELRVIANAVRLHLPLSQMNRPSE